MQSVMLSKHAAKQRQHHYFTFLIGHVQDMKIYSAFDYI